MATSIGAKAFTKRMKTVAKTVEFNVERSVQSSLARGAEVAVLTTPVDTTRAASNWAVSLNSPKLTNSPPTTIGDVSGARSTTVAKNNTAAKSWRVGVRSAFVANGVDYIEKLDKGSSQQAPNGMLRFATGAMRRILSKAKLLRGL